MVTFVVVGPGEVVVVLVELGLVEQRYQAVLEVVNQGATVTEVARPVRGDAPDGASLVAPVRGRGSGRVGGWVGAAVVVSASDAAGGRGADRGVAPVSIRGGVRGRSGSGLEAERVVPLPGRSSIYRCLVRHGLIEPEARRRKKADYKRWERSRAMELWQMDIVGGVRLVDGWKASIVSGVDDHSRFVISAQVVERATARPVCDALAKAMRTYRCARRRS